MLLAQKSTAKRVRDEADLSRPARQYQGYQPDDADRISRQHLDFHIVTREYWEGISLSANIIFMPPVKSM